MTNDIITIVVPVYNTEKYVGECLDSLLSQTYKDIKIICVNDGSIDKSQEVVKDYIKKDNRISLYSQENKGAASARNHGIDIFLKDESSDLVTFVDSDDTVEHDFIENLYETMKEFDADVATCDFKWNQTDRGTLNKKLYSKNEAIYEYFKDKVFYESSCSKLLKKDTVRKERFNDGKHFEDTFICYRWLNDVESVAYIDYRGYNVRERIGSTTRLEYSNYNYDKVEASRNIFEFFNNSKFARLAYNKYLGVIFYFILKTNRIRNKVTKNEVALNEIKEVIKKNGFKNADIRFYPFILATKMNLLNLLSI